MTSMQRNKFKEIQYLKSFKLVLWDFDGVIKDSNNVKGEAFCDLFPDIDEGVKVKIIEHHHANGGVSRHDKIPLYLSWAGIEVNKSSVNHYLRNFSSLTLDKVINSAWVIEAIDYIKSEFSNQIFIMVTATPQTDIDLIVDALQIRKYFKYIFGSPESKQLQVIRALGLFDCDKSDIVMVGDSESDYSAAKHSGLEFLLRPSTSNIQLINYADGLVF